jgi:hypothetical protein
MSETPLWYVEDLTTAAKQAAQSGDREETIKQLENALAHAKGEKEWDY